MASRDLRGWMAQLEAAGELKRVKTLVEMADAVEFYFKEKIVYDEKAAGKFVVKSPRILFPI